MKKYLPTLFLVLLVCCTQKDLTVPDNQVQNTKANVAVSYTDKSISISGFKAQADNDNIKVTFTTLYEKNIVRVEVLRGVTSSNLCSIYKQDVKTDTYAAVTYSTNDVNENKASNLYYIVKYTLANGDWGYTPVFELAL